MATIDQILSSEPYFSKYDHTKNYIMSLFKPGHAVQSRELNEIQSALQNQISKFGNHIFKNGSVVLGGETVRSRVIFLKIQAEFQGIPIDVNDFIDKRIVSNDPNRNVKAVVVDARKEENSDPNTLFIVYDGSDEDVFSPGDQGIIEGSTLGFEIINSPDAIGESLIFAIHEGIFFIDQRFVYVPTQSVIPEKYRTDVNGYVGFEYDIDIVTSDDDTSLRDPAQGVENYNAPGADRLRLTSELKFFRQSSELPDNFITVFQITQGVIKEIQKRPDYNEIEKELARRTFLESGDYTVKPFQIQISDHTGIRISEIKNESQFQPHEATAFTVFPHKLKVGDRIQISGVEGNSADVWNGEFTVDEVIDESSFKYSMDSVPTDPATGDNMFVTLPDYFTVSLGSGIAFVKGFERETVSNFDLAVPRARSTSVRRNHTIYADSGVYLEINNITGYLDDTHLERLEFRDSSGVTIGTFRNRGLEYVSPGEFNLYVYDINWLGLKTLKDAVTIFDPITGGTASLKGTPPELKGNKNSSLNFTLSNYRIRTLRPDGNATISYTRKRKFEGNVDATGAITFNVSLPQTFVGQATGTESVGSVNAKKFIFFNKDTGGIIEPSSFIINSNGTQLDVKFPIGNFTVVMLALVKETNVEQRGLNLVSESKTFTYDVNQSIYSLEIYHLDEITAITDSNGNDIKSYFSMNLGFNEQFYDHASVLLKSNIPGMKSGDQFTVEYKRYLHTNLTPVTIDSFPIPETDKLPHETNTIDFKFYRIDGGNDHEGHVLVPGSEITVDFEYYLPRKDVVFIDKFGDFKLQEGIPSENPLFPKTPLDGMALYKLTIDGGTFDVEEDVTVEFIENKRFTMRDIGELEKRIERLEYYTALGTLDLDARSVEVKDANGLDRFKNGFYTNDFSSHVKGKFNDADYLCAVDPKEKELRPAFIIDEVDMKYSNLSSANANQLSSERYGKFVTLPFQEKEFLRIKDATDCISINPYLELEYSAVLYLDPPFDHWKTVRRLPDLTVVINKQEADELIERFRREGKLGTRFGEWNTTWSGTEVVERGVVARGRVFGGGRLPRMTRVSIVNREVFNSLTREQRARLSSGRFTATFARVRTTEEQERQVFSAELNISDAVQRTEDKIVDKSIIYWMRAVKIRVSGEGFRPFTNLKVFVDDVHVGEYYTPNDNYTPDSSSFDCKTDKDGNVVGYLSLPGGKFRTGERVISYADDPRNKDVKTGRFASAIFEAKGIRETRQKNIYALRSVELTERSWTEQRTVTEEDIRLRLIPIRGRDPLAQSFYIDETEFPNGLFLSSVDLFFCQKDEEYPVFIELRNMVNGFPNAYEVMPMGRTSLPSSEIKIPEDPYHIDSIRATPTTFKFDIPIYLEPGKEYAIVARANTTKHRLYVNTMGEKILGTDSISAIQESFGSLFKSQNARTWTPTQNQDLLMTLRRCEFDTSAVVECVLENNLEIPAGEENPDGSPVKANIIQYNNNMMEFPPVTHVTNEFKIKDAVTGNLDSEFIEFSIGSDFKLPVEKVVDTERSLLIRHFMSTITDHVAPVLDLNGNYVITVHNQINNAGLLEDGFVIKDEGSGYDPDNPPTVTITPNPLDQFAEGAAITLNISTDGRIVGVQSVSEGSYYENEPTITLSSGTGQIEYKGRFENSFTGGNAKARFISPVIQLADKFVSDFITCIADINSPQECEVLFYAKFKSKEDPEPIHLKNWKKLKASIDPLNTTDEDDFREVTFEPFDDPVTYQNGNGTIFNTFDEFQIKIVMLSSNTSVVPRVRDLRVISSVT